MHDVAHRHETAIRDGDVYVGRRETATWVGELDAIVELVGGPAWTISYSGWQRRRYPDLDTSDEGLTVDVVDIVNGMVFDDAFLESLSSLPAEPIGSASISPRTGLFVGRLLESLETGID